MAITTEQELELKTRLGQAIGLVPGKSEEHLLVGIEDKCRLFLVGDGQTPLAYLEVSVFGNEAHAGYAAFTKAATQSLQDVGGLCQTTSTSAFPTLLPGVCRDDTSIAGCLGRCGMEPGQHISLTLFSDPMMGLAYERKPTLDRLAAHYGRSLELRHAMVVLVRDAADFMTGEERALPPAEGLARYNARLAQIYLDEEAIGGLPMNMGRLRLFDVDHRTSEPLCLAFEAARIASPSRAEAYLRAVRRATIVEGRQTTRDDVLRTVALETGIDLQAFDRALVDGSAAAALLSDMEIAARVGVSGLPALLLHAGNAVVLTFPLMGCHQLRRTIDAMADQ